MYGVVDVASLEVVVYAHAQVVQKVPVPQVDLSFEHGSVVPDFMEQLLVQSQQVPFQEQPGHLDQSGLSELGSALLQKHLDEELAVGGVVMGSDRLAAPLPRSRIVQLLSASARALRVGAVRHVSLNDS